VPLAALSLAYLTVAIASTRVPRPMSITYDEPHYSFIGDQILRGETAEVARSERTYRNIVPATGFHVAIGRLVQSLRPDPARSYFNFVQAARLGGILAGLGLLVVVFLWARALYGPSAAILAALLCAFDPNLIAHARVIHQTTLSTLGTTLCLFALWAYLQKRTTARFVCLALSLGAAQLTRLSAPLLFPVAGALWILHDWSDLRRLAREGGGRALARAGLRGLANAALLGATALLILNLAYGFDGSFARLRDLDLMSGLFTGLAHSGVPGAVPLPLPAAYVYAVDFAAYKVQTGYGSGIAYAWGHLGLAGERLVPIWWYYVVAVLFKFPLGTLAILIGAAVAAGAARRLERGDWFVLLPAVAILGSSSLSAAQLGIRYVSAAIPLLVIFGAGLLRNAPGARRAGLSVFALAAALWVSVSTLRAFPDYIGYFNELCPDPMRRYRFLADSNLSWGQNDFYVTAFLQAHPEVRLYPDLPARWAEERQRRPERFFDPEHPQAGLLLIDVNRLVGVLPGPSGRWILDRDLQPVGGVFGSHLLFEIRPEDLPR
jgi:dolichyl-phosphate-mannose-protein mannosyltransferase